MTITVLVWERCHCWCWRRATHIGIPSAAVLSLRQPENLLRKAAAVLWDWPWEEAMRPQRCISVWRYFNFHSQCPCLRHFLPLEDRTFPLVGGLGSRGWMMGRELKIEDGSGVSVCSAPASEACPRVVKPSGDRSCLRWCLASYNLQKAQPFLEVCQMRVCGKGGMGEADYSDTYWNGGFKCPRERSNNVTPTHFSLIHSQPVTHL